MDWKVLITGLQVLIVIANVAVFAIIKFNDLRHLSKDVSEIKDNYKEHCKEIKTEMRRVFNKINKVNKEIVAITTRCNERHKK